MKKLAALALSLVSLTAAIAQENRWVRVINQSSQPIYYLYASNVDRDKWEEDILGDRVLQPGQSINVRIDDGTGHCLFDLKVVAKNGAETERRGVNVCTAASWTITDGNRNSRSVTPVSRRII